MKLSQFNIIAKEEEKYIVYNTFSTACITLNQTTYEKIFINKIFDLDDTIKGLYENGILVDDIVDEVEKVEKLREVVMSKNIQNIVILTTTDCNARCYYCFEHGIKPVYMDNTTADAVVEFCKKKYPDKKLAITWFGGEPLMNFDIVKYISDKLISAGYELETHVTTNGSLLTEEMISYLKDNYSYISFQITLDSIDDEYGRIKNYIDIDKKEAFSRVLNNVKLLIKNKIKLLIRVNFMASKIEEAKESYKKIISLLDGYDLSDVNIYMAPLTLPGDKEIISNFKGEMEHPFLQMVKLQREEGFALQEYHSKENVSLLSAYNLSPVAIPCGMTLNSRVVVNADGELYKCHRLVGKKQFSVGNVFEGYYPNNKTYELFHERKIVDEQCRKCSILPICQAGCKYLRLTFGEKQKCNRIIQVKEELVKCYYNELKKSIKEE